MKRELAVFPIRLASRLEVVQATFLGNGPPLLLHFGPALMSVYILRVPLLGTETDAFLKKTATASGDLAHYICKNSDSEGCLKMFQNYFIISVVVHKPS